MTGYTIQHESNAYFNGADGAVYRDGERVATVGIREGQPAVEVKSRLSFDPATRDAAEKIGDEEVEAIWEGHVMGFWEMSAPELALEHGYQTISRADARAGGYCPTRRLRWPRTSSSSSPRRSRPRSSSRSSRSPRRCESAPPRFRPSSATTRSQRGGGGTRRARTATDSAS